MKSYRPMCDGTDDLVRLQLEVKALQLENRRLLQALTAGQPAETVEDSGKPPSTEALPKLGGEDSASKSDRAPPSAWLQQSSSAVLSKEAAEDAKQVKAKAEL